MLLGSFITIMLPKIAVLFYTFWRKCQSFWVSFSAPPTVSLTLFYTLNVSALKYVHQHLFNVWETALDLKAALLSALRRLRWELEYHFKRYSGDMHSSLKPKCLDSEVSHPKLSLVQTFLKSWNNRWYLLDKIPAITAFCLHTKLIPVYYEKQKAVFWLRGFQPSITSFC